MLFELYCPHCQALATKEFFESAYNTTCHCGKGDWAPIAELRGMLNAGPVHALQRDLARHDNGECPFVYTFDDPAVKRAYDCSVLHLHLLQGAYFRRQWEIADAKGLL